MEVNKKKLICLSILCLQLSTSTKKMRSRNGGKLWRGQDIKLWLFPTSQTETGHRETGGPQRESVCVRQRGKDSERETGKQRGRERQRVRTVKYKKGEKNHFQMMSKYIECLDKFKNGHREPCHILSGNPGDCACISPGNPRNCACTQLGNPGDCVCIPAGNPGD